MSTTTRVLDANVNGTVYTANANAALEAIDTCHSGATAPTDEVANGKMWLDTSTTPAILKIYNNAAWEAVVNTTNVTASGALMDSELTDIASVKALDQGVATTDSPTFAALTSTGTIAAPSITLSSGALNGVTSSDTFKRVVQAGVVSDSSTYTTTTQTSYAAAGPGATITPQSPGNTKLVGVFSADMRSSVTAATADAGTLMRLKYYDGSAYVNTGTARTPLFTSNLTGTVILDDAVSFPFELSNAQRRSDTGDWFIKMFFHCQYANNASSIYGGTLLFWEVDE